MSYILAIDQSTAGTKALIFDKNGRPLARHDVPHRQIVNQLGWVEHDAQEIFSNVCLAAKECIQASGIDPAQIKAVGLSNQRETVVCWDRVSGKPVYNAIVWQCPRAAELTERISHLAPDIRSKTGLNLSPYFSAPKAAWILENVAEARCLQDEGRLCVGTIDSWMIFNLTEEHCFKTDYSNASRTSLLNLDSLDWDDELIELFSLKRESLPELCHSDCIFGYTDFGGLLPEKVPIASSMGDSHAALFANACFGEGMAKATFGTGTSVMMNVGNKRSVCPSQGIVESIAWAFEGQVIYALEGNINYSGAIIRWLVNDLELISASRESGIIASQVENTGGVYLVPAFSGLGAPYWLSDVRAILCGMSSATKKAHVVRAAEEAIAYQIRDITDVMASCGFSLSELCVDGGATRDKFLMKFVADILNVPLKIACIEELSAAGAAYMAALRMGIAEKAALFSDSNHSLLTPSMETERRDQFYDGWKKAVAMAIGKGEKI